jgi:hypothetical protein
VALVEDFDDGGCEPDIELLADELVGH